KRDFRDQIFITGRVADHSRVRVYAECVFQGAAGKQGAARKEISDQEPPGWQRTTNAIEERFFPELASHCGSRGYCCGRSGWLRLLAPFDAFPIDGQRLCPGEYRTDSAANIRA